MRSYNQNSGSEKESLLSKYTGKLALAATSAYVLLLINTQTIHSLMGDLNRLERFVS